MGGSPCLRVDSFPELMDLIARWSPAVQAAALVHLIDDLNSANLDDDGLTERLAARFAYGAETLVPKLREERRMVQEARRRRREAQKAAAKQVDSCRPPEG